jgi:hypothetical protein
MDGLPWLVGGSVERVLRHRQSRWVIAPRSSLGQSMRKVKLGSAFTTSTHAMFLMPDLVPPISLIPLAMLFFGIGDTPAIVPIYVSAIGPLLLNIFFGAALGSEGGSG